jgi:hypothetical protein
VRAETMVPDVKEYISESIDNPEVLCDSETWDRPGFTLVLSWLAQKWLQKCRKLTPRGNKNPEQYLTKEQQKACLDSAAAELIREITQQRPLNYKHALQARSYASRRLLQARASLPALICSMDAGISLNAISTNGRAGFAPMSWKCIRNCQSAFSWLMGPSCCITSSASLTKQSAILQMRS